MFELRVDITRDDFGMMFRTYVYCRTVNQRDIVVPMFLAYHFFICKEMETTPFNLRISVPDCDIGSDRIGLSSCG
jgi:hypothetical protein